MARTKHHSAGPALRVDAAATLVAAARAVATKRGLITDPFAEPLVRATRIGFFTRLIDGELDIFDLGDDAALARMIELFAVRSRFFDDFVATAVGHGIRQVVILASGLDARPYRLWWPPGTAVYELDQPSVIEFKTGVLRQLGATPTVNRRAVGVNLNQDWPAALRRVGFDGGEPGVWIAEGLLSGVLSPEAQDRLLDNVTALSAAGSRLAADHMPTGIQSWAEREQTLAERWRHHGLEIGLTGLTYAGRHHDVGEYLAARGWETATSNLADLFAATGLPRLRRDDLANIPVSQRYVTATRRSRHRGAAGDAGQSA
ncbi:SAM-dependent methyltransferase [Mycobacterium botniense]|uniref:S-adenosyl-L-methionine-dependent methyltransferase n=1 Tax=Mycobacterium botniense TaxID=84962 RepID=A0A7I9XV89_9MYCO|nr:SAM-dependent methyltransferase [Mycobacterium botniense]GFG73496.1 putative S-adenosyl-L-methionine-dependent methyltransferase [Mycobacterium botniense]